MAADSSKPDSSKADAEKGTAEQAGATAAPDTAPSTGTAPAGTTASDAEASVSADADSGSAAASEAASDAEPAADAEDAATTGKTTQNTDGAAKGDGAASDSADSESSPQTRAYPPALIATAVALPVVLIVAVLVAAILARKAPTEREPLVLGPVPAPAADGPACTTLLPALPAELGDYTKSQLVEPSPPATRAWQHQDGGDPIVLRCGLDRPLEFNRASALQIVDGVQWFEARDPAAKAGTWFAVDRETYIALTVPDGSGPTPLQAVSDTITANLPEKAIDPGPLPN
jgi:hypothetical protein